MGTRGLSVPVVPRFAAQRTGLAALRALAPQVPAPTITIGVLVDWLENEYQSAVVGGVVSAARESGINLVCFTGGVLHSPYRFGEQRNAVYDLASSNGIDGLVILAGTLGNFLGLDDLVRYCERFRPLPMSSIAAEVEGMTSILIDSEQALRQGIRHLVEVHEYRRIAFLGGPEGNPEARARLRIYDEVLAGYALRPPDSLVVTGDFAYQSGVDGMRVLLDERAVAFDAIVVANDQMALGVIDALRARGIRIPRDVAIIGFDDIREARYCAPPLTTIRQPLAEQGRVAVEVLLQCLHGEQVDDVLILPTELVIRRSCGCNSDAHPVSVTSGPAPTVEVPETELTVDAALVLHRPRILEAMLAPVSGLHDGVPDGWEESLLDALVLDLRGETRGFAERFDRLLEDVMRAGGSGSGWQPVLFALRREVLPCLAADPMLRLRAGGLLQDGLLLVTDAIEHTQAQHRLAIERRARTLAEAAEMLNAAFDVESLGAALRTSLPRLGVPSGYLVLQDTASETGARVAFAFDSQRDAQALDGLEDSVIDAPFEQGALLPADRACAVVVAPLFFQENPLGYAVLEMGPVEGLLYEALREQISGTLKVALLIKELKLRAGELQQAYGALQDNQQRLLSSEKMASLGRITANIAHEMNSPLAAVRTALVEIDLRAIEYQASVGDPQVTVADHLQIAAEMRAAIRLARSASERAAGFVRGIKTQTRDLAPQEKLRFDPVPVIEESLLLLSYDLRRASGGVRFDPPERPIELLGTPGRLAQIVTNLVTNALDALPVDGAGAISLVLTADDQVARLEVHDNGIGIPAAIQDKVFDPMFTTKPLGEGTGLGLSIVKDLIDGHFGGHVDLASEPGQGTTFTLTFPLAGKD